MRKFKYRKDIRLVVSDKGRKRKFAILFVVFAVLLMVGSIAVVWKGSEEKKGFEYNGFRFVEEEKGGGGRGYVVEVSGMRFSFMFSPMELEGLESVSGQEILSILGDAEKIYVIYDPKEFGRGEIPSEVSYFRNVMFLRGYNANIACENEEHCDLDLPIIDCGSLEGTKNSGVMLDLVQTGSSLGNVSESTLTVREKEGIFIDGRCVLVKMDDEQTEIVKVLELFTYKILGIMS